MTKLKIVVLAVELILIAIGIFQLNPSAAYAGGSCPTGSGCGCNLAFAPVVCGKQKCRYTNFCHAKCAGWTSTQCTDANP